MANAFATPSWTLKEMGRRYENSLKFIANVTKKYSSEFVQAGAKVGNTINYRLPPRFRVSDGAALDVQNILDQTVPISLTNQKQVAMSWSSWQKTTEIDEANERYIKSAGQAMAAKIDHHTFAAVYRDIYNAIGTPGTTPSTNLVYLQGKRQIMDLGGPDDGYVSVLDPEQMVQLVNANAALFNPSSSIAEQYKSGMFGRNALGIGEWYIDQNAPAFTTGSSTTASTPLVDGANQTGSTININGWASGATTLRQGDIIKIAGVFSVNPLSYESTGRLQQFVVTADTNDSSGATATLPIRPSIITSGPYQTVTNSPANDAVVTYWSMSAGGTQAATVSRTGMIFVPDAFAFVTADLVMPTKGSGANATRINSEPRGVAFRMVEAFDVKFDQSITRIDTIIGAATVLAHLAVRVQG